MALFGYKNRFLPMVCRQRKCEIDSLWLIRVPYHTASNKWQTYCWKGKIEMNSKFLHFIMCLLFTLPKGMLKRTWGRYYILKGNCLYELYWPLDTGMSLPHTKNECYSFVWMHLRSIWHLFGHAQKFKNLKN